MQNLLSKAAAKLAVPLRRRRFHRKFLNAFQDSDFCFVSSNCVGGRFSQLLDRPYRSPTAGLWFEPTDYLEFVTDLEANLQAELSFDAGLSRRFNYPIGLINDIRIHFMHYEDAAEASRKWRQRAERVEVDKAFLIFTDRDGATYEHLEAFDALPHPHKLMLTHRPYPEFHSAFVVPGYAYEGQVGDIYSAWHMLDEALSEQALSQLASR